MSNVLIYLFLYYTFIDSQRTCKISAEKMALFWVKSKYLFYARLLTVTLKNQWFFPAGGLIFLVIGIGLQLLHPILCLLLCLMYGANCLLQYNKVYSYMKYILYLIPLVGFIIEDIRIVYLVIVVMMNTSALLSCSRQVCFV